MEIGGTVNEFEYIIDITKIVGNDDDLIIVGAVSDASEDLDGEIVDQNSLRKAWDQYLKNPVVRLMHDSKIGAIGRVIPEYTDSKGVIHKTGFKGGIPYIVAKISQAADLESVRTKIKEGLYSGLSIGGKARTVRKDGKVTLMIKSLLEISIVDIPSNKNSLFTVVKAACTGDNCPINKESNISKEESNIMEQNEIIEIVTKTIKEMREAEELSALRKDYEALKADVAKSAEVKTEVKVDDQENVEKSLKDQVAELTATIEKMQTTGVSKGISDGEKVEKGNVEPASLIDNIMARIGGT